MAKRKKSEGNGVATKRRLRQKPLPTMEPIYHTELDVKANEYYETLRERQGLQAQEEEMKAELTGLLKKHSLHVYESADGIIVTLAEEEKIKVKKKKQPKDDDGDLLGQSDEFDA